MQFCQNFIVREILFHSGTTILLTSLMNHRQVILVGIGLVPLRAKKTCAILGLPGIGDSCVQMAPCPPPPEDGE
jgi:hypothetical protein